MDVEVLQRTLRQFAAERNWEPFHTPKNLATALMVEAAELAEIFQWMTPEESCEAHRDPPTKQHIGEEIADVLLYLLQVADHAEIDLHQAVRDKLVRNAQKYPPAWKVDLDRPVAVSVPATHVLLDFENVQPTESELRALVPEATRVWVFHGPHQKQVAQRFGSYGDAVTAVPISRTGKNALDFHLSFYMGYIAARNQGVKIVVVANDTGYEPLLEHAKTMGFAVRRHGHLRAVLATSLKAPVKQIPAKEAAATQKPATKQAAAKKVVAKQAAVKAAAIKKKPAPAAKKTPKMAKTADATSAAKTLGKAKAAAPSPKATAQRILDGLRKMGDKRPAKSASLKRALKPFLGTTVSEQAVTAAFDNLIATGAVVLSASGGVSYPGFV